MFEKGTTRMASTQELDTVLGYINNHFPQKEKGCKGKVVIENGVLSPALLPMGQYYYITGSVFNDGLHRSGERDLMDETFTGVVMPCAIPPAVISLAGEIASWRDKNPETDKTSESFGGYSYTRSGSDASGCGWTAVFASRLARWRKPYV